jgi:SAM-dependent methyltransferase
MRLHVTPARDRVSGWFSTERRLSFGQIAELYEEARPSYPAELVDDVLDYAQLQADDSIVDVGAGTGKATRLFAARGYRVVAIEPSAEMAAVARRVCAQYEQVEIVETDFESWQAPPASFGLLISGQAWHWADPSRRFANARRALQTGGPLAVFWNETQWQPSPLRAELDEAYDEAFPGRVAPSPMTPADSRDEVAEEWSQEISDAGEFAEVEVHDHPWTGRYTAEEYVRLISTHSDHVILDQGTRQRLVELVAAAINRHGGAFELGYVARVCLARAV